MANPDLTFTEVTTTEDVAFELLSEALALGVKGTHIYIYETSGNDALFSVDGGATFSFLKGDTGIALDGLSITGAVQGKNNTPGSDVILSGRIW